MFTIYKFQNSAWITLGVPSNLAAALEMFSALVTTNPTVNYRLETSQSTPT